jgi:hypothetical protein
LIPLASLRNFNRWPSFGFGLLSLSLAIYLSSLINTPEYPLMGANIIYQPIACGAFDWFFRIR